MNIRQAFATLLGIALTMIPRVSMACATCFGAEGSKMTTGSNNAIIVLLVIVGVVQTGFLALFITFWRRARANRRLRDQFHVIAGGLH